MSECNVSGPTEFGDRDEVFGALRNTLRIAALRTRAGGLYKARIASIRKYPSSRYYIRGCQLICPRGVFTKQMKSHTKRLCIPRPIVYAVGCGMVLQS